MKTEQIEGYLIAQSPIHHGGNESSGSEALLKRIAVIVDGDRLDMPVLSGNAIRGILRRYVMSDMLSRLDYKPGTKLYHTLFTGGLLESVESGDSGVLNLDMRREMRQTLPVVSLLGTAIGNQMFEGKLKCMMGLPICNEMRDFIPSSSAIKPQKSIYDFLSFDFQTRKDDLRGDREKDDAAHQMLVNFETMAIGTPFYHEFVLTDASDVEKAVLARMINLWRERPYFGGKSGTGHGKLKLCYDLKDDTPWLKFIEDNQADMLDFLKEYDDGK